MVDAAGSGAGAMVAGIGVGGLANITYQGFASGMASPATAGLGAVNIGIKLFTGMPGMTSTPSARTTVSTGTAAANTQPGASGMNAVGQSDSVRAPLQEGARGDALSDELARLQPGEDLGPVPRTSPTPHSDQLAMGWVIRLGKAAWEGFKAWRAARAAKAAKTAADAARAAKSIRSLEKRLLEHRKKLEDYRRNPDAFDNKDFLKNAPSPEVRERIIQGRIKHLEDEVRNFEQQLEKLRGGGG
jgi:hypothetical protein